MVNESGNHSASAPSRRIRPATPRNDAADRYSPEIALALATGPTVREATRKSDVLRATRTPNEPMTAEVMPTSPMATSAMIPGVLTALPRCAGTPVRSRARSRRQSWTWSAKFCSTRSATRV